LEFISNFFPTTALSVSGLMSMISARSIKAPLLKLTRQK